MRRNRNGRHGEKRFLFDYRFPFRARFLVVRVDTAVGGLVADILRRKELVGYRKGSCCSEQENTEMQIPMVDKKSLLPGTVSIVRRPFRPSRKETPPPSASEATRCTNYCQRERPGLVVYT
jgi:hypothetical protein